MKEVKWKIKSWKVRRMVARNKMRRADNALEKINIWNAFLMMREHEKNPKKKKTAIPMTSIWKRLFNKMRRANT